MKRPLVFLLIFLISGILTGRYAQNVVLFFVACLLTAGFICFRGGGKLLSCFVIFVLSFCLGIYSVNCSLGVKDERLDYCARAGDFTDFSGLVTDISYTTTSQRQKIILKSGGIKIQAILEEGEPPVELGQSLTVEGALSAFEPRRNPGAFDEFIYMRSRKVQYKIPKAHIVSSGEIISGPDVVLNSFREKLAAVYDEALPATEAGIAKSIVLGDKTGLEDDIREIYQKAGVYHILAISGLHVSIISLIILKLLYLFLDKKSSGVVTILLLSAYCLLTGCGVSTIRAVVMFSVAVTGRLISRENDLTVSTAFACTCLLVYEPLYLFDIGFQYSFLAVFGLAGMTKPIERLLILLAMKFPALSGILRSKFLDSYLVSSLAATLATTPVLGYHFFYMLPYSVFANLLILPSVSLMLGMALLTGIAGLISGSLAAFFSGALYFLLKFYEAVCGFFAGLPGAVIITGQIPLGLIFLWYVCCAALVFTLSARLQKMAARGKILFLCVALLLTSHLLWVHTRFRKAEVTILDVSGGNCVIINKNSKTYMIDCGGWYNADVKNNSGIKTITPYLNYKGIKKLDGFFSTYSDADSIVNLEGLMTLNKVENIFVSGIMDSNADSGQSPLRGVAFGADAPVHEIYPGDVVRDGDFSFECLTPDLTLLFSCDGVNILFIGEADHNAEQEILNALGERSGNIDIIKFASNKAANSRLVREISPEVLAACNGRYAFKWISEANRAIAAEMEVPLYDTAVHGAVVFKIFDIRAGHSGFGVTLTIPGDNNMH